MFTQSDERLQRSASLYELTMLTGVRDQPVDSELGERWSAGTDRRKYRNALELRLCASNAAELFKLISIR